jgi:predicted acetyltransferase
MRIGQAVVRMGDIAGLHTHPGHRMKGYARKVMEYSSQYMYSQGYDISILFGIRGFYRRFGYAPCLAEHKAVIATREAEKAGKKKYKSRTMTKADIQAILKIYDEHNRERTGTVLRPRRYWKNFRKGTRWGHPPLALVFLDRKAQIIGYAAYDDSPTELNVVEVGARSDDVFGTLLKEFALLAVKMRTAEINFFLPQDHPFAYFLERFDLRTETFYRGDSRGLGRIINQKRLLEKMQKEFERRLAASRLSFYCGALEIRTDLGTSFISIDQGKVTLSEEKTMARGRLQLSQWALLQAVMGYRDLRTLLHEPGVKVTDEARQIADALFPKGARPICGWQITSNQVARLRSQV